MRIEKFVQNRKTYRVQIAWDAEGSPSLRELAAAEQSLLEAMDPQYASREEMCDFFGVDKDRIKAAHKWGLKNTPQWKIHSFDDGTYHRCHDWDCARKYLVNCEGKAAGIIENAIEWAKAFLRDEKVPDEEREKFWQFIAFMSNALIIFKDIEHIWEK